MAKKIGTWEKKSCLTHLISIDQYHYVLSEFLDRQDFRMVVVCGLLFHCIRVFDILNTIIIADIYNEDGSLKNKVRLIEIKTKKLRFVPIQGDSLINALKALYLLIQHLSRTNGLFYKLKTGKRLQPSGVRMLLRQFVGKRRIKDLSCHSLRKTGARFMFDNGIRLEMIKEVLNHANCRITERYIDITPVDIEHSMVCFAI
jgi:integrase/recombinase XerD